MNERTNERADERTNERSEERTNGRMDERTEGKLTNFQHKFGKIQNLHTEHSNFGDFHIVSRKSGTY